MTVSQHVQYLGPETEQLNGIQPSVNCIIYSCFLQRDVRMSSVIKAYVSVFKSFPHLQIVLPSRGPSLTAS